MKTGSQADLRRHLESEFDISVSRNAISLLVKAKDYRIIKTDGGKIKIEETAKALVDSGFGQRSELIKRKKGTVSKKETVAEPPTIEEHEEDLKEGPLKVTDSRERIEKHLAFEKAKKERIANEKSEKELVNFNATADSVFNFLRPFRDDVQEIGKRIAAIAYQSGSKREAQKAIDDEVERIFKSRVGNDYQFDDELKKKIIQILKMSLSRQ
jgi:hypothetical protein